jgi:hypothetical protein
VYNIIDFLFKTYQIRAALKEGQNILDNGGVFVRRGRRYDISEQVKEFTKKYIGDVFDLLENQAADSLNFWGSIAEKISLIAGTINFKSAA